MIQLPKLPQLQPRERLLALGAGTVLMVWLLDWRVLTPWLSQVHTLKQSIAHMEDRLTNNQRLLIRKQQVLADLTRYRRYLQTPLTDDLQMAALLKDVETLASESHVTMAEVKPLAMEATETAKRYALEMRFECTPEEWIEFIYQLETSPNLFDVQRASLSRKPETPDRLEGTLRVSSAILQLQGAESHAPPPK